MEPLADWAGVSTEELTESVNGRVPLPPGLSRIASASVEALSDALCLEEGYREGRPCLAGPEGFVDTSFPRLPGAKSDDDVPTLRRIFDVPEEEAASACQEGGRSTAVASAIADAMIAVEWSGTAAVRAALFVGGAVELKVLGAFVVPDGGSFGVTPDAGFVIVAEQPLSAATEGALPEAAESTAVSEPDEL